MRLHARIEMVYSACILFIEIVFYFEVFKVTAVLEIKCFEVTVVLDVYHKPTPITSMCMHTSMLFMLVN